MRNACHTKEKIGAVWGVWECFVSSTKNTIRLVIRLIDKEAYAKALGIDYQLDVPSISCRYLVARFRPLSLPHLLAILSCAMDYRRAGAADKDACAKRSQSDIHSLRIKEGPLKSPLANVEGT